MGRWAGGGMMEGFLGGFVIDGWVGGGVWRIVGRLEGVI